MAYLIRDYRDINYKLKSEGLVLDSCDEYKKYLIDSNNYQFDEYEDRLDIDDIDSYSNKYKDNYLMKPENIPKCIPYLDQEYKNLLLHLTTVAGDIDNVKLLLEAKADLNNEIGHLLPLHQAIKNKRFKIVELLLEHGADPFKTCSHKPLFYLYRDDKDDYDKNPEYNDAFYYLGSGPVAQYMFDLMIRKKKSDIMV